MSKKYKKQKRSIGKKELTIYLYLFCILIFLPLILDNGYLNYMATKFTVFRNISILSLLAFVFLYPLNSISWKAIITKKQNMCFVFFLAISSISSIISDNPWRSFVGQQGRFCGLFMYMLLLLGLLIIVSYGKIKGKFYIFIGIAIASVSILNVLNHFNIDPLGVYCNLAESDRAWFSSTLGNIDNVGEYLSMMFAFWATFYCVSSLEKKEKYLQWIVLFICASAIVVNGTDGAYIGGIVFFLLYPIMISSIRELQRYLMVAEAFLCACGWIEVLSLFLKNEKQYYTIGDFLRENIAVVCIVVILFWIAMLLCQYFMEKEGDFLERIWRRCYVLFFMLISVAGISAVVTVNMGWLNISNGAINNVLLFSDSWGSGRGYIFKEIWNAYKGLPIVEKLFGIGPAMLYSWSADNMDLSYLGVTQMSNAHNMYLQILLTHGLLGLLSWIGWLFFSLWEGIKKARENKCYSCFVIAIIAYCATMLVGLNMLVVTVTCFVVCCFIQCDFE